jgi:hypothetical protein
VTILNYSASTLLAFESGQGLGIFQFYSQKDTDLSLPPVSFDVIRSVVGSIPFIKTKLVVFPGENSCKADIVALDWVDMLPADALNDVFERGLQWDEVHGILYKGKAYLVRKNCKL